MKLLSHLHSGGAIRSMLLGAIALVVILETGFILKPTAQEMWGRLKESPDKALAAYADKVVAICKENKYRPACYDKEIPKLMDDISMEDAFAVTRIIQDKDREYRYCHVLGHELSAREVKKDPSRWKEVLARCPSGVCSNGCIHGGFQERFRAEYFETEAEIEAVKPDLKTICEERSDWRPTGLEQASCYHAVGHLTMYIVNGDIKGSVALCDEVAKKPDGRDFRQLCYDGAFMQIFQPLEPEDFALIKGKEVTKEKAASFCGQFSGKALASCHTESWPLFGQELRTSAGLSSFCNAAPETDRTRCYNAIVYVMTAQFGFDIEKIAPYCSGLDQKWSGRCFADAATRLIETDYRNAREAVAVCEAGRAFDPEELCLNDLVFYSTYNFHAGSPEFVKMCEALPDGWKEKCLSGKDFRRRSGPVAE